MGFTNRLQRTKGEGGDKEKAERIHASVGANNPESMGRVQIT